MSKEKIIRAWKDENYRNSLSEAEKLQLPENPAGLIELTDDDLKSVDGGGGTVVTRGGALCIRSKQATMLGYLPPGGCGY